MNSWQLFVVGILLVIGSLGLVIGLVVYMVTDLLLVSVATVVAILMFVGGFVFAGLSGSRSVDEEELREREKEAEK